MKRPEQKTGYILPPVEANISEPSWTYSSLREKEPAIWDKTENVQQSLIKESPRLIGQLRDTYLLFQSEDGLLMIDQHAAHERILYEELKKSHRESRTGIQPFLIPVRIETSMKDSRALLENIENLKELGLDLEHFGGSTFLLRAVPSVLGNVNWESFISDLIPALEKNSGPLTVDKTIDDLLIIMACHGAIKANQRLSHMEMLNLLEGLDKLDLPTNCPHGRPIFKKLGYYDIEKMFKRVV
jgi:DNA mismatch repair protein MutL